MGRLKESVLWKVEGKRLVNIDDSVNNKVKETLDCSEENKIKKIKLNFSCSLYGSDFIEIYNERIVSIGFTFQNKKYKVSFDYSTSVINPHNSSGNTQQEEVNRIDFVGNIQVQAKVKVGYGEYKSPRNNKYRDAGISLKPLTKFIKQVLFEYNN